MAGGAQAGLEMSVHPGDVLAGKYRIERVIGSGGMGMVVSAQHLKLDERVAIKFLLPDALASKEVVARFEREARAAVKIKSEHVARVIDVGTLETGAPYIVMEYLHGSDLSKVVKNEGMLPVPVAIEYVLQAAEALAEAHAIGIVHRDLKPHNLFLARRADGTPCVKVLDFGISKFVGGASNSEAEGSLTATNAVLGSPIYMSPEQMSSPKGVDARADVWSLGATLYKLVTGKAPFMGDSVPEICGMILMGVEPPPIFQFCPDAPPGLEHVIKKCLQRNPADRWANIGDLATALAEFGPPTAHTSAARVRRVLESAGIPTSVPVPPPPTSFPGIGSTSQPSFGGSGPGSTSQPSFGGAGPGSTSQPSFAGARSQPSFGGQTPPPQSSTLPSAGMLGEGALPKTMGSWTNTQAPEMHGGRSRSVLFIGLAVGVLGIGIAVGALMSVRGGANPASTAASTGESAPSAVPAPPSAAPSEPPSATASASAAPTAEASTQPVVQKPASTPWKGGTGKTTGVKTKPTSGTGKKSGSDLFDERL